MSRYADWKAPKSDFASLVWPEPSRLIADLSANRAALDAADLPIQHVPLSTWRRTTRQGLFGDADRAVIATGHQIELYHPGVWVKNVLLDAVSRQTGAVALHVAVDTDSPKHLQLRWPGGAIDVSDDPLLQSGEWSGQVARPSPGYLQRVRDQFEIASVGWSFEPSIGPVFDSMAAGRSTPAMLPQALLDASQALDRTLGLSYETRRLTTLLDLPAYHAFVHHVAGDIEAFAAVYNAALADYRAEAGINSDSRPMPDLKADGETVELPFWCDRLDTGERARATVVRKNGRWQLEVAGTAFAFEADLAGEVAAARLGEFCRTHAVRLTPRALTLTTFLRLVVADQFVHGIGGGRYDQITDRIIEHYFRLPAPAFAVTTGTLIFPDAGERDLECVPCLVQEGHRLRHSTVAKRPFLDRIAAAPRGSAERRMAYVAMHGRLQHETAISEAVADWRARLDHAVRRRDREAVLFDRELFYAIQPRLRLERMIDNIRSEIGGKVSVARVR